MPPKRQLESSDEALSSCTDYEDQDYGYAPAVATNTTPRGGGRKKAPRLSSSPTGAKISSSGAQSSPKIKYELMNEMERAVWRAKKSSDKLAQSRELAKEFTDATGTKHLVVSSNDRTLFHFNTDPNSKRHLSHDLLLRGEFGANLLVTDAMLKAAHAISFTSCEYGIEPTTSQLRSREYLCIDPTHIHTKVAGADGTLIVDEAAQGELVALVEACLHETFPEIKLLDSATHSVSERLAHIKEHATAQAVLSAERITAIEGSIITRNRRQNKPMVVHRARSTSSTPRGGRPPKQARAKTRVMPIAAMAFDEAPTTPVSVPLRRPRRASSNAAAAIAAAAAAAAAVDAPAPVAAPAPAPAPAPAAAAAFERAVHEETPQAGSFQHFLVQLDAFLFGTLSATSADSAVPPSPGYASAPAPAPAPAPGAPAPATAPATAPAAAFAQLHKDLNLEHLHMQQLPTRTQELFDNVLDETAPADWLNAWQHPSLAEVLQPLADDRMLPPMAGPFAPTGTDDVSEFNMFP